MHSLRGRLGECTFWTWEWKRQWRVKFSIFFPAGQDQVSLGRARSSRDLSDSENPQPELRGAFSADRSPDVLVFSEPLHGGQGNHVQQVALSTGQVGQWVWVVMWMALSSDMSCKLWGMLWLRMVRHGIVWYDVVAWHDIWYGMVNKYSPKWRWISGGYLPSRFGEVNTHRYSPPLRRIKLS